MKKFLLGFAVAAVIGIALASAGFVFAQTVTPPNQGTGIGMMGGRGMRGGMMSGWDADDGGGWMHDEMIAAFAAQLGLSVDEINTRLANGETMAQIATAQGLSAEQFRDLMTTVRSQALDQAVKDGKLTQEQADWMKQRGGGMMSGQFAGRGRMMGGQSPCPYYQSNP